MKISNAPETLTFEVTIHGKEEFGAAVSGVNGKTHIIASNSCDIVANIRCFYTAGIAETPELLIEFYVDGILRNVVKPRTGRGLDHGQFAEARINRGLVLTEKGVPVMKNFRFVDLDLDDAVLNSRLVREAGEIQIRIIHAGTATEGDYDSDIDLPQPCNDRGAVSLLHGELNNTVGVRFDDGDNEDTKHIDVQRCIKLMDLRQMATLGETLAQFSFVYGSDDLLNQLSVVPPDHKSYNVEIAAREAETRNRKSIGGDASLLAKAIYNSDYTLCRANEDLSDWNESQSLATRAPARKRKRFQVGNDCSKQSSKRGYPHTASHPRTSTPPPVPESTSLKPPSTPKKRNMIQHGLITPPATPMLNSSAVDNVAGSQATTLVEDTAINHLEESGEAIVVNTSHVCGKKCLV